MAKFRVSVVINRPVQEVFDFAVDQVGAGRWQFQVSVVHLSGDLNAAGSTYERSAWVGGVNVVHDYELTTVAPPFRFEVRSTSGEPSFVYDYTFVVEGDGTQVFVDVEGAGESVTEVSDRLNFLYQVVDGSGSAGESHAQVDSVTAASERRAFEPEVRRPRVPEGSTAGFKQAFIWTAGVIGVLRLLSTGGA